MLARLFVLPFGTVWRLKSLCNSRKRPLLAKVAKFIYRMYQYENGSSVAWNCKFENEPCFPHGMKSIFISGGTRAGRNCVIFQQVTIGSNTLPDARNVGAPTIGDNCYIGAGATLVGSISIGNNVRIGANAVVYKDVPDNSVVVSGQQVIITRSEPPDNRLYSFRDQWMFFENGYWCPVTDKNVLKRLSKSPARSLSTSARPTVESSV